jgi:hypothetical protein
MDGEPLSQVTEVRLSTIGEISASTPVDCILLMVSSARHHADMAEMIVQYLDRFHNAPPSN